MSDKTVIWAIDSSERRYVRVEDYEKIKAERDAAVKDAERYRWLRDTFSAAKGGAILSVNEPLMFYEDPKPGAEVRLQWYPHTPVRFNCVEQSTLDAAIDQASKEQIK